MSPVPVPRGGVFWAPLPPFPPSPRGSGFPQGSMLPPGARGLHGSELPAMLLDFFLASSPASRGPGAGAQGQASRSTSNSFRGPDFQVQEARLPGAGGRGFHASMLSGLHVSGHPPCFSPLLSGDHAARLSGFFLTSRPAFMLSGGHASALLSCFQEAGARLPPGARGPGLSGCFQEVFRGFQEAFRRPCFLEARARLSGDRGPVPGLPALTSHT